MGCAFYENGAGAIVPRTRIDILNCQPLEPLECAGPYPETSTRLVNQSQHFIKLKKAVPGFQSGLLFRVSEQLMDAGLLSR